MNHSGRIPRVIYGRSEEAFQIWRIPKRFNLKHRTTVNHRIVGVLINIVNRCGDETPDKATKKFSVIYDHFIEMISLTGRHSRMGVASTSVFVQELRARRKVLQRVRCCIRKERSTGGRRIGDISALQRNLLLKVSHPARSLRALRVRRNVYLRHFFT
jgi:hypothetical protein